MDGTLIDSEPLWWETTIGVFNYLGIYITTEDCKETTGMRTDDLVAYLLNKHQASPALAAPLQEQIEASILAKLATHNEAKAGVIKTLEFFKNRNIPMCIASSSNYHEIKAVVKGLNIEHYFRFVCSSIDEEYAKPHPAVYLTAAEKLGFAPQECLVFEDSVVGMVAAKAANMCCIVTPTLPNKAFALADLELESLEEFDNQMWLDLGGV